MKYLYLVWKGIWRKRGRATLMLLQIVSVFLLFGLLQGVDFGVQSVIDQAHGDRLYVMSKASRGNPLPSGLLSQIQSVQGVEAVSRIQGAAGTYRDTDQVVGVQAVDVDQYFRIYNDYQITPASAVATLEQQRTGAIVGVKTLRKYGWKIGDHVALQTNAPKQDGSSDWGFDIVGSYDVPQYPDRAVLLLTQYDYLNEGRRVGQNRVGVFILKIDDPSRAGAVSLAIDNRFANSSHATLTRSEADLIQTQISQIGNLGFVLHGIIAVIFFAVLFSTGALMMQSLRERLPELAAMKAIGFSSRRMLWLVFAESALFCVGAAVIGLAIAAVLMPFASAIGLNGLPGVPGIVFVFGIICALVLAVIGAWAPAWRAARLPVAVVLAER